MRQFWHWKQIGIYAVVAAWVGATCVGVTACGKKPQESPLAEESANANGAQGGSSESGLSEADAAWKEVRKASRLQRFQSGGRTNQPSEKDLQAWRLKTSKEAVKAAKKAKAFYEDYPDHPRAGDAKQTEHQMLSAAVQLGATNKLPDLKQLEEARLSDQDLSSENKLQIAMHKVQREAMSHTNVTAIIDRFETGADALLKEYPGHPQIYQLTLTAAQLALRDQRIERARKLTRQVREANVPPQIAQMARKLKTQVDQYAQRRAKKEKRLGKPLKLEFTSVRGEEVDMDDFKGKVVLIDFWATWCGPCLQALPRVKETYDTLHPKGFDIVGISLDRKREDLVEFLKKRDLPWPQYFNQGGPTDWAGRYGIRSIPEMWLVDKNGVLRSIDVRGNLKSKVKELLAESPEEAKLAAKKLRKGEG